MKQSVITVYEYECLRLPEISLRQLEALRKFYGNGCPYFSIINNGVKFCEYVGVIQVGDMLIEILPKADRNEDDISWRFMLIEMLKAVGAFDIHAPSSSSLSLKSNSILDLYFELFICEAEYLLRQGLLKKYRKKTSNINVLKGAIKFSKHIQLNLLHKERFFVEFTTYDVEHNLHFIIYKTITLLSKINVKSNLAGRISALLLNFPEMPDIIVNEETFKRVKLSRKTQSYAKALEISKLLLLNFHPDVSKGSNHVLALMFDMNLLWEQFVYNSLRKQILRNGRKFSISAQTSKYFWKPKGGIRSKIRPDIVITNQDSCVVIDTKWKNLNGYNPSPEDLRQMYVYHDYYNASKVALMCPGDKTSSRSGKYLDPQTQIEIEKECSIISLPVVKGNIRMWEKKIYNQFVAWFEQG